MAVWRRNAKLRCPHLLLGHFEQARLLISSDEAEVAAVCVGVRVHEEPVATNFFAHPSAHAHYVLVDHPLKAGGVAWHRTYAEGPIVAYLRGATNLLGPRSPTGTLAFADLWRGAFRTLLYPLSYRAAIPCDARCVIKVQGTARQSELDLVRVGGSAERGRCTGVFRRFTSNRRRGGDFQRS